MDLSRYTVLEVGEYVSVPYAGKLLADLGARVIKVEPVGGDVARRVGPFGGDSPRHDASGFFSYLNTGKESVTVARNDSASTVIRELVDTHDVDVVIEDDLAAYGLDPRGLSTAASTLSVVSISGFGVTGPYQAYEAPDIVVAAESGQMNKMGYPDRPPTRMPMKALDYLGGIYGAMSALAALYARERGADGQHVDVSSREAGVASLAFFITGYSWSGATTQRTGDGFPRQDDDAHSRMIYETADGYVSLSATRWETFCEEIIDRPDLVEDERFATRQSRREHVDAVRDLIASYTRERSKWEVFEAFQDAGMPSGVTTTVDELVALDHLDVREFWTDVELPTGEAVTMPGFPFLVDNERIEMDRAPRLGEHDRAVYDSLPSDVRPPRSTNSRGTTTTGRPSGTAPDETTADHRGDDSGDGDPAPLDGIRVLDLTWVVAGPQTTKILAALGADVVKVESRSNPDVLRLGRGYDFDTDESLEVSAFWHEYNQGKRSIQLDLTSDRGGELVRSLVAEADVVAENFSPGFMERIGLGPETIHEINSEAIYMSMPGWGNEGPAKTHRSYGLNLQSMAGMDALSGFPGDPPTTAGHSWPDYQAGALGAFASIAGLLERERTGTGTYVEVPQFEMAVSLLHKHLVDYFRTGQTPDRHGNRDEDGRFVQGAYECAGEDRWAVIAIETDEQWRELCRVIGRPGLVDDERFRGPQARHEHHDEIDEILESWTRRRSRETVRALLQARDVPAGIVADERDLVDRDPQLRTREFFVEHDHPEVGSRTYSGMPFHMRRSETGLSRRPPLLGEHTDDVLQDWLGLSASELEAARDEGTFT